MFKENEHLEKTIPLLEFAKKREFHLRILQLFLEDQENVAERIYQAFFHKDVQEAERKIHTLKGLLGTIGADSVYPIAKALEDELSKNSSQATILQLIEQLAEEMFELVQIINNIIEKSQ